MSPRRVTPRAPRRGKVIALSMTFLRVCRTVARSRHMETSTAITASLTVVDAHDEPISLRALVDELSREMLGMPEDLLAARLGGAAEGSAGSAVTLVAADVPLAHER